MSAFDVPEVRNAKRETLSLFQKIFIDASSYEIYCQLMAVARSNICANGMESMSRWGAILYYASVFLYFWVLSTPAVSFVFGSYLYVCINWFNLHYDEAFSSLRIADYKAFTRFHIKPNGDLQVFTLAVDKVRNIAWSLDRLVQMGCSNVVLNESVRLTFRSRSNGRWIPNGKRSKKTNLRY